MNRRSFLTAGALGTAALAAGRILADPYEGLPAELGRGAVPSGGHTAHILPEAAPAEVVRVRGVVRSAGRGIPGVSVSDGLGVTASAADGSFEIVTTTERDFVRCSIPAGYRIPTSPTGTARFYDRITAGANGEMEAVFELERLEGSDENHTLLLLPDPQMEDELEVRWFQEQTVPDVQETVRALGGTDVFGIADGDIMFDNLELYPGYERGVQMTGIPFFQVVGNHDLDQGERTDEASTTTFSRHFGPRYYSFDRGAVHYVVLDDVFWHGQGYIGYLDAVALTWLQNDLASVEAGRPVIVATHIPALGGNHVRQGERNPEEGVAIMNRQALYRLLEPYRAHILTGHTHENEHIFEQGTHEHVSGTVCGAWWSGPICWDGAPSGYSVYEARGEEISWRYKATGEADDLQIRVYPRGADPTAPNEVVANVWDWDPEWTVTWYEDGEPKGLMAQRLGLDPLSVELHTGDELPPRRPWVDPRPTLHMFYAPASPDAREIRVEARDRFGRTYTAAVGQ